MPRVAGRIAQGRAGEADSDLEDEFDDLRLGGKRKRRQVAVSQPGGATTHRGSARTAGTSRKSTVAARSSAATSQGGKSLHSGDRCVPCAGGCMLMELL